MHWFEDIMYMFPQFPMKKAATGIYPDSKVHGANMGPTWVLSAPDGPHVGPVNLAISLYIKISTLGLCPHPSYVSVW